MARTYDPSEPNPLLSEVGSRPFSTEAAVASTSDLMKSARAPGVKHVQLVARTLLEGKVIDPPKLRDWKCFAEGKKLERWGLINFSSNVIKEDFIEDLRRRSRNLGMHMKEPEFANDWDDSIINKAVFSSVEKMGRLLRSVGEYGKGIQIIIFIWNEKHESYWFLKWVLETQIGLISQFCLERHCSSTTDKTKWAFLDHLCMKINEKIGGSNVKLIKLPLPHGSVGEHVMMFIGASVNHPKAYDETSPSIAAVVGTVNWPGANRYVARIETQKHRSEGIVNFGAICEDLVNTFSKFNKVKPDKIVVFRDSVGHEGGKLDMVANCELRDLKEAISTDDYKPTVTLILVRKRHHTHIFRDIGRGEILNVRPGTVVDSTAVHFHQSTDLDFYLCSHDNGGKFNARSKPMHYRVLRDESSFPSHDLQKLIYHLCFAHARSAIPASLAVPVYYANLAATRGRGYYEASQRFKKESDAATSSSSSSVNPSVQDEDCCRVHPKLANEMFFI